MRDLKEVYREEIESFRKDGHRFLNKELNVAQFKGISGGMGIYAQRGGQKFMVRLRLESGILDTGKLEFILGCALKYNLDKVHLTTRQSVQLHDLDIDDVCDIALAALDNGIYIRGGGGNFPRNVSLSPLAGVDIDEPFDVTPYALAVNDYFMRRMNTYKLPRKLKTAFSSSKKDTANATINDLGFLAEKDGFKLYIAGGMGRNPSKSVEYDKIVKPEEVLYYVEAMVRFFAAQGDYENKAKARTRYIAQRMSREELISKFDSCLEEVKRGLNLNINAGNIYEDDFSAEGEPKCGLAIAQKQKGLYSIEVCPQAGILMTDDLKKIIEFGKDKPKLQYRLSMEETLYVRNLTAQQADEFFKIIESFSGKTPLRQSMSCIGVPTCQIGIEQSRRLLLDIYKHFEDKKELEMLLPSVSISGCGNSCSRHQVAKIGLAGKKVNRQDGFEVHIKGSHNAEDVHLGEYIGDIAFDDVKAFLESIASYIKNINKAFDELSNDEIKDIFKPFRA